MKDESIAEKPKDKQNSNPQKLSLFDLPNPSATISSDAKSKTDDDFFGLLSMEDPNTTVPVTTPKKNFSNGYYVRTKYLFEPKSSEPFKLSRTKIELFTSCPRCFYLDRRLGTPRPDMPGFTLNNAVDTLLKKEFDLHRAKNQKHPLMAAYNIDAIPFSHEKLADWRHNFTGIQFLHQATNFLIFGAVDDLWVKPNGELIIVDYKATSTQDEINLDDQYKQAYKRQMEIYQWLFRQNGFQVSQTGYFVYCNGLSDRAAFDGKLEFDIQIIPYKGDDSWVEKTLVKAKECLSSDKIPAASGNCDYCKYRAAAAKHDHPHSS